MSQIATKRRIRRTIRTRAKISGNAVKPRLTVFRSNRYLYLQLINDEVGKTIISASSRELASTKEPKLEQATKLGVLLAKKALEAGIKSAVLDRRFYKYHGRVKAAAEGARSGGLKI